ncbi:MAG: FHA domain-containing protein, partial [Terriglobia bacterium]
MSPKLVTLLGPHRGKVYNFDEKKITIGRLPSQTIFLPEQGVSRQHCILEIEGGHVILRDMDSRNGTRVNGMPVMQRALEDGDVIEVGDSQFLVLLHEPQAEETQTSVT